jgi:hypothetical protein
MQSRLIPMLPVIACLLVACNEQPQALQTVHSQSVDTGRYIARAGDVRQLLRRIDAATRNVQNAEYVASISHDGEESGPFL